MIDITKDIIGVVVDKSNQPLKGAMVMYGDSITYSNVEGEFLLNITPSISPSITITSPGYSEVKKKLYKLSGEIRENIGVVILKSNDDVVKNEISSQLLLTRNETLQLSLPNQSFELFQQKKLRDLVKTLKYTLLPIVLNLLISFGISKVSEAISKKTSKPNTCPSPEKLKKIIEKRNKLVKQLNISFTVVDTTLKSLGILQGILVITEVSLKAIPLIPYPTPPIVPTIGQTLDSQVKKYKNVSGGILSILSILRNLISSILQLLSTLDSQIQSCTESSPEFESINPEIVEQLNALNRETPPSSFEKVNGFVFDVETERTTDDLKRKRAIAKNSKGVILLRGEYSYSSSTQILIEELAFYIKINNLKAD